MTNGSDWRITAATIESDVVQILEHMFGEAIRMGQVTMRVRPMEDGGVNIEVASPKQGTAPIVVSVENADPTIYLSETRS